MTVIIFSQQNKVDGTCGLYYKHTTIVHYASSVVNKLEALLIDDTRVIIYDRRVFIVQATGVPAGTEGIIWQSYLF